MLHDENYSLRVSVCDWWSVCMCRSVRELSVVLNPSVTPYIWERTRKITQNPCFPAPTSEWQKQILLHASNTHVKPCTRSGHNSAQFSKQNVSCVCTSICWLLHQGQMIIILQHSKNKSFRSIKRALNGIMHARLIKYPKENCTGIIFLYITIHVCIPACVLIIRITCTHSPVWATNSHSVMHYIEFNSVPYEYEYRITLLTDILRTLENQPWLWFMKN